MELDSRIPEKLFFRIGEVCELIKVQPHVLRYWETEFPMLAPQKNRAGQRMYRRKDVEMVLRIHDLLYEEKFTIAGAKKKLAEEMRPGASRAKAPARESVVTEKVEEKAETIEPIVAEPAPPVRTSTSEPALANETALTSETAITPQARRALRIIKRDLEDLLTMLNSDASIKA